MGCKQLMFFMWYLLENYSTNPDVKYLVDNLELYFIPDMNPDGYAYNYLTDPGGGGMWRKNRKRLWRRNIGVDLNRNFGYKWDMIIMAHPPTRVMRPSVESLPFLK